MNTMQVCVRERESTMNTLSERTMNKYQQRKQKKNVFFMLLFV